MGAVRAERPATGLRRALGPLPVAFALVAEGAWIAVAYALVQAASGTGMPLNAAGFALFAAAGLLAGIAGARRIPRRWPVTAVALTAAAAAAGWLVAPDARAALAAGNVAGALVLHPGGWLAGLACLRGVAAARDERADDEPATLMPAALLAILVILAVGSGLREPLRAAFLDAAVPATILFIAAGTVGPALARMRSLGTYQGFDWRRNPAWLGLLAVLVLTLLAIAVPAAYSLGPLVVLFVAALPVPMFVAGLFSGIRQGLLARLLPPIAFLLGAFVLLRLLFGSGAPRAQQAAPPPDSSPWSSTSPWLTVALWVVLLGALAITIVVLAAIWMRQAGARADDDVAEERVIDRGEVVAPAPRRARRRWRGRPEPQDAPAAYLSALAELDRSDELRRDPAETPGEHARRVRLQASPSRPPFGPALELLAADYELARFGAAQLSPAEHGRARRRWLRIREALGR